MILSAILFALSLCFLWYSMRFSMPTQGLALRKAEAEHLLPPGEWTTTALLDDAKISNAGDWYFSRRGDDFYYFQPTKNFVFWYGTSGPYRLTDYTPQHLSTKFDREDGKTFFLKFLVVVTPDSAVARMDLVQNGRAVPCTETTPGSGFWLGRLRNQTDVESNAPISVRAYAADGTLLYATPDPLDAPKRGAVANGD